MLQNKEYLEAVRTLARAYGISFEEMLERERMALVPQRFQVAGLEYIANQQKIRDQCVYFCYQEVGEDAYKYMNGETLHGYYRIVKTDSCYEFTIMDTDMQHESWQKRIAEKHVTRFPLEVVMGSGSFKDVTPEKIHLS
jgi:hypothetical protein